MKDTFLTIQGNCEGTYKEKGSKFLAFGYYVTSKEEVKTIVDSLRKKYFDARHHCYAYILGKEKKDFRANDDGEPGNSAGNPILGQIRSRELTNTLIVVVRYFGGTKLGVGGLITAYKTAAFEALENVEIIEKIVEKQISIGFEYLSMNEVMKAIKEINPTIVDQVFDNQCVMNLSVREKNFPQLYQKFQDIEGVTIFE